MGDFTVDTNMFCFLCSDRIIHQHLSMEQEYGSPQNETSSLHSLQHLSHYLKIDMGKVFTEEENGPHPLIAKVKKAKLKVELCEECTHLNEMFSKLYQKLRKIEMEVGSCLRLIHCKLKRATESGDNNDENFPNLGNSYNNECQLLKGKKQIASLLRSEMILKCSPKITDVPPIVKLQKLTVKQVNRMMKEANKLAIIANTSQSTLSTPTVESVQFKEETPDDDFLDDDEGMGSPYLEYEHDPKSEYEESTDMDNSTGSAINFKSKRVSGFYSIVNGKYKCQRCPKLYSGHSGVYSHYKRAHCKIRYECKQCDQKFKYKTSLNRHHRRVHKQIRFKCGKANCGKSFGDGYNLRVHIQSVHNNQKHRCQFCSELYTTKAGLRKHVRLNRCKWI